MMAGNKIAETSFSWTGDDDDDDDDNDYDDDAHCEELLAVLRSCGPAKLQERGEGGVGLMNQGATCYMNSLLQSLFYTPEFRLAVYGFEYDPELHGEASRCIPLQLQKLFAELQISVAGAASTKDLTTACGFTGRDAMQQHDVQELCRVLFDALERSSSLLADAIRGLYAGKSTSYIKCREEINGKVYQSARTEKYMDLQVPIQDCSSLEEALRKLVEPEVMEGDNQWLCEELGEKVDALKGLTIETLPKILCIQLLRFVFDVATMRRKKLSEVVALPLILDLAFLSDSGSKPSLYQLAAVCLHSGTAHGGHYHAFAWDPCSGAWRDANDTRVQVLSAKQCSALFGADDSAEPRAPQALHSADAYFLLYRQVSETEVPRVQDAAIPQCLRDQLLSENQRLSRLQRAYDLHRKLLEVKVFHPLAAQRALQRYAAAQLEALGAAAPEAEPEMSVTVKTSSQRPAAAVQRKVLKSLASSDMSWCRDVDLAAVKSARLRLYDPWRGLPGRPLEGIRPLGDCLRGFNSTATLVMELPDTSGCFEQWQEDRTETFLVLWDKQLGAPSLGSASVVALRLPPAAEATCVAGEADLAKEPTQVPPSTETYEPEPEEVQQDLFALEVPTEPARSHGDRSPLLRTVREAAATLWNLPASSQLALVPLSGMQAGKELKGDDLTLQGSGCEYGDIICVEQLEGPGASQAVQLQYSWWQW
ncbi:Ubiquitin carboxyl-terminal hydrolase 47 [Symbiodinium microadriaticum]|uniref:Ubiquitin carboxyl-terminal hydrolase n=2 Tax=Symbiodinium TaxID=2949 RepID=A0A1Q9EV77_SYMMI|nr:Ubiquitin carboxyl-terminal hydrolase 47 [Symbiodinium microadriaticum]